MPARGGRYQSCVCRRCHTAPFRGPLWRGNQAVGQGQGLALPLLSYHALPQSGVLADVPDKLVEMRRYLSSRLELALLLDCLRGLVLEMCLCEPIEQLILFLEGEARSRLRVRILRPKDLPPRPNLLQPVVHDAPLQVVQGHGVVGPRIGGAGRLVFELAVLGQDQHAARRIAVQRNEIYLALEAEQMDVPGVVVRVQPVATLVAKLLDADARLALEDGPAPVGTVGHAALEALAAANVPVVVLGWLDLDAQNGLSGGGTRPAR